ncbi:4-hydroxybenzoate polyprenyltransferase [Arboricoccus pini]|uniref:4-hydroxybenzoate octaprenyltransferase n=2 Tax=Arboricoccus pini TaxID=1963835 RepID=A0A212QZI7_9PROT|nr:4-hydroxybenzoate polyprenyltransferase [Arboricoccus pini]
MLAETNAVQAAHVPDRQHHWVDRLPLRLRAFAILARLDRPIGTWLLLLPCWWGLALAADYPNPVHMLLFAIGAIVMRGAGCTINDIVDREFDAKVERTKSRPIASGLVTVPQALLFVALQGVVGLIVLLQLPGFAIAIGFASLPLIVAYPFMKRITWWPQAFLGLAFNWGILVGYATATHTLSPASIILYVAGIFWTLGYDTIYAHQDKVDDAIVGVKSTARLFGKATSRWLWVFYAATMLLIAAAGALAAKGPLFWAVLILAGWSLVDQIRSLNMDDPDNCIAQFRKNRLSGLWVALALALGTIAF